MGAEPLAGPWEAFYYSTAQHPGLLWLAAGAALAAVLARRGLSPSLRRYALALCALAALDAWLTSDPVPGIGALPDGLASTLQLVFVLAGDYRYLLLVFAATADGRFAPQPGGAVHAAALALVVPVSAQLAASLLGGGARVLFLVYELAFLALAAAIARYHPQARRLPWVRALSGFVMLYYALWASADALLLAHGSDLGYALRVLPNLLYYGGFAAALAWLAPSAQRSRPAPAAAT